MRGVRRTSVDVVTRGLAALRHGAGAAARYGRRGLAEDVFASSPVALAFLDTRLRFCRVNEAFTAMTGVSVPAHVGRTPMDLVPGIDPRQYLPHLRAVLAGTPPPAALTITSDPRGSDRATRSWTVTFHPVRVSGGRVRGVGVAAVDVTEQTAAKEARRREEATARLVLESAPNGMLLVDAGGRSWR